MKILVGYNGGEVGTRALELARDYALKFNAFVYVVTSMEGGSGETPEEIEKVAQDLELARRLMEDAGVECEVQQSVRGMSPGEDLVSFAREKGVDQIFLGIKKKNSQN